MKDIIVTPAEMKVLENASQSDGISLYTLMKNAGKSLSELVSSIAIRKELTDILVVCGKGNNGGDGLVCAEILSQKGFSVSVILCCGKPATDLSKKVFSELSNKVQIISTNFEKAVLDAHIIVDCVFGTGFHGNIKEGSLSNLFDTINLSTAIKIGCDIPSGANALNGKISKHTIECNYTATFGALKTGMLFSPCKEICGKISAYDIGITQKAYTKISNPVKKLSLSYVKNLLPERKPDSNKGTFGKLINVAGSKNYIGAAALSTLSALRSGVGLCTLATSQNIINNVSGRILEATYLPLSNDYTVNSKLILFEPKKTAILFGCGLGNTFETQMLCQNIILNSDCPVIIDADGINVLADCIDILRKAKASIVLTPHPGEFSRLTGMSVSEITENKLDISREFSMKYGVTIVLKGAGTIISCPNGDVFVSSVGNNGLSRGGSGDVLAGIIGSLVAQGIDVNDACCAGVFLHGLCADRVASKLSMQGMLPSDLINELPLLFHDIDR